MCVATGRGNITFNQQFCNFSSIVILINVYVKCASQANSKTWVTLGNDYIKRYKTKTQVCTCIFMNGIKLLKQDTGIKQKQQQ